MTGWFDSLIAALLAGLLNAVIFAVVSTRLRVAESTFLSRVYVATLLLRAAMAVGLNAVAGDSSMAGTFWGDSETYDAAGQSLTRHWEGEGANPALTRALSGYGFVYYVGAIYFVFGRNQLLVQLLNVTIGSLTVVVVYAIGRQLFGPDVARWSALFMAFFPQMLFWSAGMYKDPAVLLCIALSMFAVLRLRDAFSPGMASLLGLAAVALLSLRFYVFYFVALAALGALVCGRRGPIVPRLASYGLVLAVLVGAFTLAVKRETLEVQRAFMTLDQMQVTRMDQAMWGKSAYGTEYDVSTPGGALKALPVGLAYLLFAPFPWAITNEACASDQQGVLRELRSSLRWGFRPL